MAAEEGGGEGERVGAVEGEGVSERGRKGDQVRDHSHTSCPIHSCNILMTQEPLQ